jgi:hypothetical protein
MSRAPGVGAFRNDRARDLRGGVEQVPTVVEDQQRVAKPETLDEGVEIAFRAGLDAEEAEQRTGHELRSVDGVKRGEPHAVAPLRLLMSADLQRQLRLADTADTGERDDPCAGEVIDHRVDVVGSAEQRPRRGREVPGTNTAGTGRPAVTVERGVLQPVQAHRVNHVAKLVNAEVDEDRRLRDPVAHDLTCRRAEEDL